MQLERCEPLGAGVTVGNVTSPTKKVIEIANFRLDEVYSVTPVLMQCRISGRSINVTNEKLDRNSDPSMITVSLIKFARAAEPPTDAEFLRTTDRR